MTEYAPGTLEQKWQRYWEEREVFRAHPYRDRKFYCYNPAPYVTGTLHMGHVRNYTYGDFLSKFQRLRGANVLYTIGFDAFGVPTELAAIRNRIDPIVWTDRCIAEMKAQMARMGLGFDWTRSFRTSDPGYYRWTQWIFIQMFRDGLVYEREAETLWCPRCEMALAKSLTTSGRCCLCEAEVEVRSTPQWFLRISRYLDRLREDLATVRDLNGQARAGQESLLSRESIWGVRLEVAGTGEEVVACLDPPGDWERNLRLSVHPQDEATRARFGLTRADNERRDHATCDRSAIEPRSGREFDVVLDPTLDPLYLDRPRLTRAGERPAAVGHGEPPPGVLFPFAVYRQKDFSISRQRLWGTPIPIVRCGTCGPVPIDETDLPVLLPPIASDDSGRLRRCGDESDSRPCPTCGRGAALDPQVLDCHFDALWHICRPCVASDATLPFGTEESRYWLPVDMIQFGRDTIPFLLTMRMFIKFLHERGLSECAEFTDQTLAHGLILMDQKKMSKHLGNVVNPDRIMATFGADSLRFCALARNDPKSDYSWSNRSIEQYHELLQGFHDDIVFVTSMCADSPCPTDSVPRKYVTVFLTKVLREVSVLESSVHRGRYDIYARAVGRLLTALHVFRSQQLDRAGPWTRAAWSKCAEQAVVYLAPIAPHLAEECWERFGRPGGIFEGANWPAGGVGDIHTLLQAARERGGGESPDRVRPAASSHGGPRIDEGQGAPGPLESGPQSGTLRAE